MQLTVPVPTFSGRITVPIPSLSRKQLMFMGGAAALGVVDVLSAPVAVVIAAAPLLQKGIGRLAGSAEAASANGARTRTPARRSSATSARPSARSGAAAAARTTRRPAARSTRRPTGKPATATATAKTA